MTVKIRIEAIITGKYLLNIGILYQQFKETYESMTGAGMGKKNA
jgi:hypothetical protein